MENLLRMQQSLETSAVAVSASQKLQPSMHISHLISDSSYQPFVVSRFSSCTVAGSCYRMVTRVLRSSLYFLLATYTASTQWPTPVTQKPQLVLRSVTFILSAGIGSPQFRCYYIYSEFRCHYICCTGKFIYF